MRKMSKIKTNNKPSNKILSAVTRKMGSRETKTKNSLWKNNVFRFETREQENLKLSWTLKREQSGSNFEESFVYNQKAKSNLSGRKQLQFWPSESQLFKFNKNIRSLLRRHNDIPLRETTRNLDLQELLILRWSGIKLRLCESLKK